MRNVWLDGMMGLIIGDALGVPVQFLYRREIECRPQGPVVGMEGNGTYNMPKGTWSDDGSMALATLHSIGVKSGIDLEDIMKKFVDWELKGHYTQYGVAFDQGNTCTKAIYNYIGGADVLKCGCTGERSNGNGSLMRILPACIHLGLTKVDDRENAMLIHKVSGLTHNHLRSKIACGIYYYIVKEILEWREKSCGKSVGNSEENTSAKKSDDEERGRDTLMNLLQNGIDKALRMYGADKDNLNELAFYRRIFYMDKLKELSSRKIESGGYVVHTLEAALWCLITTNSYAECLLKAVNLGDDTDTVAAVAGGLAGLFYGVDGIPKDWIECVKGREMVEELCEEMYLRMLVR